MKKISLLLIISFVFVWCTTSQKDVSDAKQKLLQDDTQVTQTDEVSSQDAEKSEEDSKVAASNIQIIPQDSLWFLSFDDITQSSLTTWEVKISGIARSSVEKIQVLFSNPTSGYPDDDYTLQTYKQWDSEFRYMASSRHQVLDFGENNYIFRAYSWDQISETKIVLNIPDESQEVTWIEKQLIGEEDNTIMIDLPTSSKYGEPMMLWESSFTYTQIKWLELSKEIFQQPRCETLTEFLWDRINVWYYWNTCRDIVKEKGIKFNVIRLEGEDYIYERHYIDFVHGFYGTYELEKWSGVTSENIAEKNTLLKEQEFPSLEIVDDLLKDIVNS